MSAFCRLCEDAMYSSSSTAPAQTLSLQSLLIMSWTKTTLADTPSAPVVSLHCEIGDRHSRKEHEALIRARPPPFYTYTGQSTIKCNSFYLHATPTKVVPAVRVMDCACANGKWTDYCLLLHHY